MRIVAFLLYLFAAVIFLGNALASGEAIGMAWGFMVTAIATALYVLDDIS